MYEFGSLGKMVATSDVVLEATVVGVQPGRIAGGEGHESMQFAEVTLEVDAVGYVRPTAAPIIDDFQYVVLEEIGWIAGESVVVNHMQPSQVGDTGFYFMTAKKTGTVTTEGASPVYFDLVSSQGRYLDRGGVLEGSNIEDPLVQEIQAMSPSDLRTAIEEARQSIESGELQPEPAAEECPYPGCPRAQPMLHVDANYSEGPEYSFHCVALGVPGEAGGVMHHAVQTSIDECRLEIKNLDTDETDTYAAPPASNPGSSAATYGLVNNWFDGGSGSATNVVRLCWTARTLYDDGTELSRNRCEW